MAATASLIELQTLLEEIRHAVGSPIKIGQSGRAAEDLVENYLRKNNYQIVARNLVIPQLGELDIISMKDNVLCFVEVRSRQTDRHGNPAETVGFRKQQKLKKLASIYLARNQIDHPARFDVASVVWRDGQPFVDYIEDAFD